MPVLNASLNKKIINTADSIILDLSTATLSSTYLDVPILLKSDDAVFSFDYAFLFNLSKLTYSTTILVSPAANNIFSTSFFNPQDLFLRSTNSSLSAITNLTNLHIIRFVLSAPCVSITTSDFSQALAIINGTQCSMKISTINFARFIPIAQYSTTPLCQYTPIIFTNNSSLTYGTISSSIWNFDGQISNSTPKALCQYSVLGTHTVQLSITTLAGCSSTLIQTFSLNANPIALFTSTYSCNTDSVHFSNLSQPGSSPILSYFWYFEDQASSLLPQPSHRFSSHKIFKVILKIEDVNGCTNTSSNKVEVLPVDFSQDGLVDINDFLLLAPNYDTDCP